MAGKTLYDKLWDDHLVKQRDDGSALIYIDRQLLHEVTSPQAFEGLRLAGRKPWRIDANIATPDHNVPTTDRDRGVEGIVDPVSRIQVETLDKNCDEFGILEFKIKDQRQGIVHVIGPEQGATLPGMSIVCGDSHTSTHGAFGCLAHGIGTSEVEHVLATQCLVQQKMKNMLVKVNGKLGPGVTGKDVVLAIIGKIGTAGGTGHAIEFGGEAIQAAGGAVIQAGTDNQQQVAFIHGFIGRPGAVHAQHAQIVRCPLAGVTQSLEGGHTG